MFKVSFSEPGVGQNVWVASLLGVLTDCNSTHLISAVPVHSGLLSVSPSPLQT